MKILLFLKIFCRPGPQGHKQFAFPLVSSLRTFQLSLSPIPLFSWTSTNGVRAQINSVQLIADAMHTHCMWQHRSRCRKLVLSNKFTDHEEKNPAFVLLSQHICQLLQNCSKLCINSLKVLAPWHLPDAF